MTSRVPAASAVAAGLALIVLPLLALVLKASVYAGWMLIIAIWISPVLLIGYATQVVIAANGLLRSRGVLRRATAGLRGVIAAWSTSLGVLGFAFFLVDGGDDGQYGSAFTELLGVSSTAEGGQLSTVFSLVCAAAWLGAWLWLVIEWSSQLVLARRARAASAADPEIAGR